MKIAVLGQGGFEIQERKIPTPGTDEVLVKTGACGVCSGDLFLYKTRIEASLVNEVLGHEASGTIVEAGANVRSFAPGDIVTAIGGAYADYFVINPRSLAKIPETVDPLYALGEPVACCVHAGHRFGIKPGDRVAVVGCGFMGLICLQLARYQGAGFICAVDPLPDRRDMARRFGANETLNPKTWQAEDIWQGDFDVVIEAAGSPSALDVCSEMVRQHGRLILVGYHQSNGGQRTVNMKLWNYKALDVINGHVRREDEKIEAMRQGLDLMEQGHLHIAPMVTTYGLSNIEAAFQTLANGQEGLFKAVIIPEG